jgi:PAS domain S-box-containing protein
MNAKINAGKVNSMEAISSVKSLNKLSIKERLIKERELSDLIINCLPGVFYLVDRDGNHLRWNKNFEKVTGYSAEEISNMHSLDFFERKNHDEVNAAVSKVYREGYNEIEMEIIDKNGKRSLFHFNGIAVTHEGKSCMLGAGMDLSCREDAQREIRENEKKYRSLFEQASDPILVTDYDGNFTDVNGSFCKLFGYTKRELLRMNIKSLVCPIQLIEKPIRNDLVMKGKHFMSDRLMIHKNGNVVETEANVKKFGEDRVMAIVRDVTQIRKMQREMEKERLELQIQEQRKITRAVIKAQERERNIIGRELHDNVNQLLASTRMVLATAKGKPGGKKDFIDQSIRLIDSTILEIRVLGRKHVTPLKGFDLKEQIQSLIKIMEEGIGFKISFEYDLPNQPELLDDLKLNIYRVIQEQLNNVYKHASASRVQIIMFVENGQIHVLINDNGIGFEVGMKKSGVGIVNIINRVESFNGKVGFETKPGVGCKLDIRIPMIFQK